MDKNIESFGNYVLLKKIAIGGMAEVFLARPAVREGDGRLLVIKRILPHIANQSEFVSMFQQEIQTIMGFNHTNVVQLHDFGSVGGQPYIAMEFIEGKSIRDIVVKLKSKGIKMPVPVVLSIVAQAASGLHYAHTFTHKTNGKPLNTIHRDLTPHNLILSYDGNLKLIDFGIAKASDSARDHTQVGGVKGKAGYFSPEQAVEQKIDAHSDIFSLGVVAWELLTGERLFVKPGDSDTTVMSKVIQCDKNVVRPSSLNKDVMLEIDNIILKALEKDPSKRFHDAREFQYEIRRVLRATYPAYDYADTGHMVSILFAEEMKIDRMQTNELNIRAQNMLIDSANDKTLAIDVASIPSHPMTSKLTKRVEVVASRLSKLEIELKQKAMGRHYLMLVFYITSLFVIKLGDRYNYWIELSVQKAKASEIAAMNAVALKPTVVPSVTVPVRMPTVGQPVQVRPLPQAVVARVPNTAPTTVKLKNPPSRKTTRQQH